uniref:Hyaluronidase n=1 Tax=Esox lucius TaxID=8010 RepID=A0AAY5K7W2_ESOLU
MVWLCILQEKASLPTLAQVPFLTVWNAPTGQCKTRYGVDLDLGVFNIVSNQNQSFMGDNITIFYKAKLGLYPEYVQRQAVNGGVPQNASLPEHLRTATENIQTYIPDRDFQGLAVVDWESWRPVWERNWENMNVYWEGSRALVKAKHPDWSPAQVEVVARQEFQVAARDFMEGTLRLGGSQRPRGMWGFYGFPCCYNYYKNTTGNYTGECPQIESKRNDALFWLWNASSALYPDIYLDVAMRGLGDVVRRYTNHRVMEAMRVGAQVTPNPPPYLSLRSHRLHLLPGSAALGSAGIVLWGDNAYSKSKINCEAVKNYLDGTLGPYLVNVTTAATLCSRTVCSSHGRCQRRDRSSTTYLHLDPRAWTIVSDKRAEGGQSYRVLGKLNQYEAVAMRTHFQCLCYPGWGGENCSKQPRSVPNAVWHNCLFDVFMFQSKCYLMYCLLLYEIM